MNFVLLPKVSLKGRGVRVCSQVLRDRLRLLPENSWGHVEITKILDYRIPKLQGDQVDPVERYPVMGLDHRAELFTMNCFISKILRVYERRRTLQSLISP